MTNIGAMRVGIVYNASLAMNGTYPKINASSCHECLCTMLYSSQNISILSLNCHTISINAVSCEMFTLAIHPDSSLFHMERNSNSTYYFQQFPTANQSISTTTTTSTTSTTTSQTTTTTTSVPPCSCNNCYVNPDNTCGHSSNCYLTTSVGGVPAGTAYPYTYFCYLFGYYGVSGCPSCTYGK